MKILVITGGTSSERRISFLSARAVKKGLEEVGYKVQLFDFKKKNQLKNVIKKFDVIFPVLHGEEGEGGDLQKYLAELGKPYVGGSWKGFKKGWHKIPFKEFCKENNITTAPWKEVKNQADLIKFGFPSVLKSSNGGSSREVIILKSANDIKNSLCQNLLKSGLLLFVEKYLPGVEVTVGILGNQALPILEIIPPKGGWFDYKNKYNGQTQEIPHAPSVSPELKRLVQKIALEIHQKLDLGPYSRIDFIISTLRLHPKGVKLTPYVLEVNTIPGFTSQSLFPKAAQAAGISFPKLLDKMIKMAKNSSCLCS